MFNISRWWPRVDSAIPGREISVISVKGCKYYTYPPHGDQDVQDEPNISTSRVATVNSPVLCPL